MDQIARVELVDQLSERGRLAKERGRLADSALLISITNHEGTNVKARSWELERLALQERPAPALPMSGGIEKYSPRGPTLEIVRPRFLV